MIGMIWLADAPVFQPGRASSVAQRFRSSKQRFSALRLLLDDVERRDGRGRRGGGRGRGKHVRPGTIHQPLDKRPAAGDESAHAAQRLAERADADVDAVFDAQVLGHAPAVRTENARRVGFVHHQHRVESLGQIGQFGQRRQVAVHAEQAVGHDQPPAVLLRLRQATPPIARNRRADRRGRRPARAGSRRTGWRGSCGRNRRRRRGRPARRSCRRWRRSRTRTTSAASVPSNSASRSSNCRCNAACPVTSGLAPLPQPSRRDRLCHGVGQARIGSQGEIIVRAEVDQTRGRRSTSRADCGPSRSAAGGGDCFWSNAANSSSIQDKGFVQAWDRLILASTCETARPQSIAVVPCLAQAVPDLLVTSPHCFCEAVAPSAVLALQPLIPNPAPLPAPARGFRGLRRLRSPRRDRSLRRRRSRRPTGRRSGPCRWG